MTGFKKRFAPAYVKARALLEEKEYGEPAILNILRTSGAYKTADQYILDSGIHVIDLATFLFGPVRIVHAKGGPPATFSVTLDFTSAAVGTLALTDRMSYALAWEQVTLMTTEGLCVQVDNSVEMLAFQYDRPVSAHKPNFVSGSSHSLIEMGFVNELQAFVDAIASDTIPESSIIDGNHTMAVIEAINSAVRTGQPANVEGVY
jgi:predicted dehydrogenase